MPTPQQTARKWNSRLKGATTEIREGVEATEKNPMALAAANPEKWLHGVQNAVEKFVAGLNRVPVEEWKRRTIDIGIPRIAAGADAAIPAMEIFFAELADFQATISRELASMPDVNLEDSIARATHQIRRMAEFTRRG